MGLFFKNKSKETPDKNVVIERSRIETDFRSFVAHIATKHSGPEKTRKIMKSLIKPLRDPIVREAIPTFTANAVKAKYQKVSLSA